MAISEALKARLDAVLNDLVDENVQHAFMFDDGAYAGMGHLAAVGLLSFWSVKLAAEAVAQNLQVQRDQATKRAVDAAAEHLAKAAPSEAAVDGKDHRSLTDAVKEVGTFLSDAPGT